MSVAKIDLGEKGSATFSDADTHELTGRTVSDFSAGMFTARITARRVSDGAAKSFLISFGFKKEASGTDAAVYSFAITDVKGIAGDLAALNAVTASAIAWGENTSLLVQGLAGTEIDWIYQAEGEELIHS